MKKLATLMMLAMAMAVPAVQAGNLGYDPSTDPFVQYRAAVTQAAATDKLVLIIAGGAWCRWCHVLNRFIASDAEIERRLHDTFVVMKVYVGPSNYNELFFSQLPQAHGAPHFWVVSPSRAVLASQSTIELERGRSGYDKARFLEFLNTWQQPAATERQAHAGLQANF